MNPAETRVVIEPRKGWLGLGLVEVWRYRELLYFLIWRDVKVRYKQTVLGAAWAVIQPFMTMVVFTIFFGRLGKIPSDGLPYPIFAYCGLLPWQLFSNALSQSSNSLIGSQTLITKVYFPRLVIPMASVLGGLVDFGIAFVVLLGLMAWYGVIPTIAMIYLPLLMIFALVTAFAVGLWLSALNVRYRDVRYTLPFLVQLWLFLSPIAYPSSMVPEEWRLLYGANPMVGVVEGFRWALLGNVPPPGEMMWVSVAVVALLLLGGLSYFRRTERTFADVI